MGCCGGSQNHNQEKRPEQIVAKEAAPAQKAKISLAEWLFGFAFALMLIYVFTKIF